MAIIEAQNLNKFYGNQQVLFDLSLKVEEGSSFALLGQNGAGKTTFVKALLGLVSLKSGTILLAGEKIGQVSARSEIAYLPEKFNFYPYYTVASLLNFYGKIYGVAKEELKSRVENSLDRLGIASLSKKKLGSLSKGQLQRTGLAAMLVGKQKILILDEPFSGLDPIGIKELKDILKEEKASGKTIFINSHILSEMEKICDNMAILDNGVCLEQGVMKDVLGDNSLENYFYKKVKKQ